MSVNDKNIYDRLNDFRVEIQDRILNSQRLLKLLKYTEPNPLAEPDISLAEAFTTMVGGDGNIFFQPRAEDSVEDTKSMLVMTMGLKVSNNSTHYADVITSFTVLVHHTNSTLMDNTDRLNHICSALYDCFGETDGERIGKMYFVDGRDVTAPTAYHSHSCSFKLCNFL